MVIHPECLCESPVSIGKDPPFLKLFFISCRCIKPFSFFNSFYILCFSLSPSYACGEVYRSLDSVLLTLGGNKRLVRSQVSVWLL